MLLIIGEIMKVNLSWDSLFARNKTQSNNNHTHVHHI